MQTLVGAFMAMRNGDGARDPLRSSAPSTVFLFLTTLDFSLPERHRAGLRLARLHG
jgi:hypothetical protein